MKTKLKKLASCVFGVLLGVFGAVNVSAANGDTSVYGHDIRCLKPYLHEVWYDNYEQSDLEGADAPFGDLPSQYRAGCSSVRVGNFHGRNLDMGISDLATVVVRMKAGEGRFASVGTTQWSDVSETALKYDAVEGHRFDVLPNFMLDGINEKGVAINVNVIPMDVMQEGDPAVADERPALHARKVVRYVLDHAESAEGVIEQLKGFRIHGNIGTGTYNLHWMISDAEKTFVVEVIGGEVVARETPIMTNFHLNWDNVNKRAIRSDEFAGWGPEKYEAPAKYSANPEEILNFYTRHAEGVERYIRLRDANYETRGTSFEGMFDLMREVQFTRITELPLNETFISDLPELQELEDVGIKSLTDVYATSNATKLAEVWKTLQPTMTNAYAHLADLRKPGEMGEYSITTHNVTFDLAQKMFRVVVQEEYNEPHDFWLFPHGSEDDPWKIGATDADSVVAYTNWAGNLFIEGAGKMADFTDANPAPWAGDRLAEVTIGEGVTAIGANCLAGCPNLTTLVLYEQTPPTLGAGNDLTGVTVIVLGGAGSEYAAADGWKTCNLVEMCGSTRKVADQLYTVDYEWYDFLLAERIAEQIVVVDPLKDRGGDTNAHRRGIRCLAVCKDGLVGRNLDAALATYDEHVVRTSAAFGRPHATLAVANEGFFRRVANGHPFTDAEKIALRPIFIDDGINDAGLVVAANSILAKSAGVTEDTNPNGNWLVQPLVTRYLLDYAGSAAEALDILTNCSTRALWKNNESECHWMIADPDETYIVECVSNRIVALKVPQGKAAAMTNFLLARSPQSAEFEALVGGDLLSTEHTPYARGIERYAAAMDALTAVGGAGAMMALLQGQRFSQVYEEGNESSFWSEANGESVMMPGAALGNYHTFTVSDGAEFDEARMSFFAAERAKAETNRKKTIHSAVYDLAEQKIRIAVQENYASTYDFWLVEPLVTVTLPAGVQGYSYVVSNLMAGAEAEIAPTETTPGGATYELPIGAKVAIYAVPAAGYVVSGTNPYVIGNVTAETTLEDVTLPLAVKPVAADTVVYGTIRTAEKGNAVAEAVAVKDGKYVYVGNEQGAAAFVEDGVTKVIDHRGKGMVMPGCTDGHSHYTMKFGMDNMKGSVMFALDDDKAVVLQKVEAAAKEAKDAGKTCLFGFGWNFLALMLDTPTLAELDEVTHGVSTVIFDQGGHHAFCNSECLKRCGIIDGQGGVLITEIEGGCLELDENGYPTGYAEERATGYLMRMGGINYDELMDDETAEISIRKTRDLLLSTGYTTALEGWSNMSHPSKLYEAAKRMDDKGELNLVFPMTYEVEPWQTNMTHEIDTLASLKETYGTRHVLPSYLKIFMDGVVETKTGAMLRPYKDDHTYYKSFWSTNRLADITRTCNAKGLTVHVHSMGDAAVRDTVTAYIQGGDGTHRNCLVHLRNVSTNVFNDFQRIADNNIACSAGITWHVPMGEEAEIMASFLEKEYIENAYPVKSFFDAGVKVSSHSDYPANIPCPQDPFGIIQVAVTGLPPNPSDGLKPYDTNELVTVEQAFQALTLNGAWQMGLENERGSIAVGKYADFVLADQDVFTCEKTDIGKTKVVETWFEGELAYPLTPGSKETPWNIGEGVEAYTNGTELVVQGAGTVTGLAEIPAEVTGGIEAITIAEATVTGAASDAFQGIGGDAVSLTLPDGWQGELPDEDGNWYGATGATLTANPLAVKNLKVRPRYPWSGLVDVTFDLTGDGVVNVAALVTTNGIAIANPTMKGVFLFDLGDGGEAKSLTLVWDAKQDFGDEGVHEKIKVRLTISRSAAVVENGTPVAAESDDFTVDLRTRAELPAGEVEIDNITWSATAWGEVPEAVTTDLAWTNETTGASGVLATGLHGPDMAAFDLPAEDGEYRLVHSTGDLISYATFVVSGYPLGSEGNPWKVGSPGAEDTVAWTDGEGNVYFKPALAQVSKAGLKTIVDTLDSMDFDIWLVDKDGASTNGVQMVIGENGDHYTTVEGMLLSDNDAFTLVDVKPLAYLDWDADNGVMTNATCYVYKVMTGATIDLDAGMTYAVTGVVSVASDRILVGGTVKDPTRLILCDGAMLMAPYGIGVSPRSALAICAQSEDAETMGTLMALGDYYAAGIGGDMVEDGGLITINGGVVYAFGGEGDDFFGGPAGIGGGVLGYGGTAVINGGVVNAVGGTYGAGIGGGTYGDGGTITVNGGIVNAIGDSGSAGIGGGLGGDGGDVVINGGIVSAIGDSGCAGIGGGYGSVKAGTLVFDEDAGIVVKAGASETDAAYFPLAAYRANHDAAYVSIMSGMDTVALKIPAPSAGFSYAVSNETDVAGVVGAFADGTNDYVFVSNDTYCVTYTLDVGYEWETAPAVNPLTGTIEADTEIPYVSAKLKTFPLVIPAAPAGLAYVVSNETAEIVGESAGGVNTYTVTYGDTVKVYFTLADGYRYIEKTVNPLVLEYITGAVELDDVAIPDIGLTWSVGTPEPDDVEAYVDPSFTNLAAVVIDNGIPSATNVIDLVALTNGFGTSGYEPAVRPFNACVKVGQDDGTEYLTPTGWVGENDTYATLEDAVAAGETMVVPAFASDEVPVRIAEKGMGADSRTYTAVVENDPGEVESPLQVRRATRLLELALETTTNVMLVATALNDGDFDAAEAADLAAANTNGVADIIDYRADHVDLAVYFDGEPQHVLDEVLAVHIPRPVNPRNLYRVSRIHEGAVESLPVGADCAVDGEYVEVLANEIVIHASRFSVYSLGEITLQPRYGVVVGNCGKTLGEPDPSSLATNFTVNVQGLDIDPADIRGYCVRAKGEAAGEYAINFVCTSVPQDYDGEFVVTPGVFTITDRTDRIDPSGKVVYAKAKKGGILVKGRPATWKAKPSLGCTFARWSWIGEGDEPAGFKKLSENERRNPTLKFTVGKKESINPKNFAASWVRIDEDTIESVAFTTNATGGVTALAVDTFSYVKASVKGLPKGMKFNAKKLKVTGKPTKNGAFTTSVTVKNASGYSWSGKFKIMVSGKKVVAVDLVKESRAGVPLMLWCDTTMGTVKGCGVFKAKSTRTVSATAKSGYVFAGWFTDPGFSAPAAFKGGVDYRTAKQKLVLKAPTYLFARFLPKTTKADPIAWLRYSGAGYCGAPAGFMDESDTWYQGVRLPTNGVQIAFASASLPTVKVTGLPKGVKFDAKKLRFTGAPTKAGSFTVKVSVKNKSGASDLLVRKVKVVALPKWVVGNFDGYHMEVGATNGTLTATVGSTGKVSGKTMGGLASTTFSASSLADVTTDDGTNLVYTVNVTVSYKDPKTKKTVKTTDTLYLMENPDTGLGVIGGGDENGNGCVAVQRAWNRKDLKLPAFDTKKSALKNVKLGNGIVLAFGANGKVTIAGKVDGVKVSGSTYVLPTAWLDAPPALLAELPVYIAPKKGLKAGFCGVYNLMLATDASGKKIVGAEILAVGE